MRSDETVKETAMLERQLAETEHQVSDNNNTNKAL